MDAPAPQDPTIFQSTPTTPSPSKRKMALLIASGVLSAFVLFSMITVPSFYAGLFRGGSARTVALSNLLRLVGANTQQPLTGPISGPITQTPTPLVTFTVSPTLPSAQNINFSFYRILYRDGQGVLSWDDQSVVRYDCQDLVGNSTSGMVSLYVQQSNSITVPMRGQIYDCTYDEQLPQAPLGYMWLKSQISTYTENNNRNVTVVNRLVSIGTSATTMTPTSQPPTPTDTVAPTPTTPPPTPSNTQTPTPTTIAVKRVFVTSQRYNGNLGGLSGADLKCQQRANAANLGGTWKAWLSSSTQSASSRLTHFNGPYMLINGTTIANNWSDLIDGTLASPINVTEINGLVNIPVWTNTDISGGIAPKNTTWHCSNWATSSSSRRGNTGETTSSNTRWTTGISELCSQNNYIGLYCFEQ